MNTVIKSTQLFTNTPRLQDYQSTSTSLVNEVSADIKDPQLSANIPLFNDQQQLESTAVVSQDTVLGQSPQPGPSLSLFQTLSLLQKKQSEPSVKKIDAETQTLSTPAPAPSADVSQILKLKDTLRNTLFPNVSVSHKKVDSDIQAFPAPAPAPPCMHISDVSSIMKLKETIRNPLLSNVSIFPKPPAPKIQLAIGSVVAPPRKSPPVSEGTQTNAVIVKSCGFQAQPPQKLPRMDPPAQGPSSSFKAKLKRKRTKVYSSSDIIRGLQIRRICQKTAYMNMTKKLKLPNYFTINERLKSYNSKVQYYFCVNFI